MKRRSYRDTLAQFFRERPNVWVDGVQLEAIAGRYAWRTRLSDCRVDLGMTIENRQRHQTDASGKRWTTSEYRYVPAADVEAPPLRAHDLNVWSLRKSTTL